MSRPFRPYLPEYPGAPWLLDLYCGAGGASVGYWRAGFNVYGVDIQQFKRYPFTLWRGGALAFLIAHADPRLRLATLPSFRAIHASPPCQAFTEAWKIRQNEHPDYIGPTRELMCEIGLPYIIENVEGAPLIDPIMLCGGMFGLRTYRHRLFETSFPAIAPPHPEHAARVTKMGRPPKADEFMHVVGHFAGVPQAREAMGIPWMSRNELKEAIPPAYAEHIGLQIPLSPQEQRARATAARMRAHLPLKPYGAAPEKTAGNIIAVTGLVA